VRVRVHACMCMCVFVCDTYICGRGCSCVRACVPPCICGCVRSCGTRKTNMQHTHAHLEECTQSVSTVK